MTYALAIYHLNLFLAFLTPKIDPAMSELDGDEGMANSLYSLYFKHFRGFFNTQNKVLRKGGLSYDFYEFNLNTVLFDSSVYRYPRGIRQLDRN